MYIPIKKIIVRDRIRKDFGDIGELARDIQDNGLINPPVVNKEYVLLAGERRLRACKQLGWEQIPVTMMDTRDAEHELNIEISENDVRKGFSKAERVDYMYRLMRIEKEKAAERQNLGLKSDEGGRADEKTAKSFGIGKDTMRKEMQIVDNKDLLTPEDFADWDEGRLSTNKAYQRIRAELDKVKREKEMAEGLAKTMKEQSKREAREEVEAEMKALRQTNKVLKEQAEKTATVVAPKDYQEIKQKARAYDAEVGRLNEKLNKAYNDNRKLSDKVTELQEQTAREQSNNDFVAGSIYFVAQCGSFIRDVGGYVWIADKLEDLPEKDREGYIKAAMAVRDWATVLLQNIERNEYGKQEIERISSQGQ